MRLLLFLFPVILNAQAMQLAPPHFVSGDVFFLKETDVALAFDLEGSRIRCYFLKPILVPSDIYSPSKFKTYSQPIKIRGNTTFLALAVHPDFGSSMLARKQFFRVKYVPKQIKLLTAPHKDYPGQNAISLIDRKKGSSDLHDGKWLGFLGDTVKIEVDFSRKIQSKNLLISTLSDLDSWIFPMRSVTVFAIDKNEQWQKIGFWEIADDKSMLWEERNYAKFKSITLGKIQTRHLRIEIVPFGIIPKGYPGADSPAWLFLDEIIFQ